MLNKYLVYVLKPAKKSVKKIPQPWQKRILDVLTALETSPFLGEKMHGDMADKRKIIIWPYRIIYGVNQEKSIVEIFEIEHRGNTSYK